VNTSTHAAWWCRDNGRLRRDNDRLRRDNDRLSAGVERIRALMRRIGGAIAQQASRRPGDLGVRPP
jgi:hypothetical protein